MITSPRNEKKQDSNEITLASNSDRIDKFRTRTILKEESGKKFVCKYAVTDAAKPFINIIARREQETANYLKDQFEVLCGTLKEDYLKYDYIPNPTLGDEIALGLRNNNHSRVNKLIEEYFSTIRALKAIKTRPNEFLKLVGSSNQYKSLETVCLERGTLDLMPWNIITGNDKWIVVDNEWSFDFPVPLLFIAFRFIYTGAIKFQSDIRYSASKTKPVRALFAKGLTNYYIPVHWGKYLSNTEVGLKDLLLWEKGFQKYVLGENFETVGRIKLWKWKRTYFSDRSIKGNTQICSCAKRILRSIPGLHHLSHAIEGYLLDRSR